MQIRTFLKKPDRPAAIAGPGAVVEIHLDESAVRMCLKYGVNAPEFMKKALLDELHTQAIIRESVYFERRGV